MTNLYNGKLRKEPPISLKEIEKSPFAERSAEHSVSNELFPRLKVVPYPSCCGIAILEGTGSIFLSNDRDTKNFYMENELRLSQTVFSIHRALDYWLTQYREKNTLGCYLMTAINENAVKTGLRDILVDYFGFEQLESDFRNYKPAGDHKDAEGYAGTRIKIMGLNGGGQFCEEDI